MPLKACGCSYRIQSYVLDSINSILFKLSLPFKGPDKLANTYASTSKPHNLAITTLAGLKALPKVYLNEKMQEII